MLKYFFIYTVQQFKQTKLHILIYILISDKFIARASFHILFQKSFLVFIPSWLLNQKFCHLIMYSDELYKLGG